MTTPDSPAARLEARLFRVLTSAHSSPDADALVGRRAAITFQITDPDVTVRVSGRDGTQAVVTTGEAAREEDSDLTFGLSARVAHELWVGNLNPAAAVLSGQMTMRGPLTLALALAPGMRAMQAAYRAAVEEDGAAGRVSTPGA
ncbi:SCP2 sterol-binding domain-containing protein [Deinococcus sp. SDU3-2]|uniref:SCP2 sterol-binding domain-containing protein n=1 Tax=Deinococcus terrestris TaxID=2651870 RepID=A0A7X1NYK7_9DEIO|nr:SCP2 sterol-binding domain-containing protein [Deinococcus terrestris]MPY68191.1 SCP2 sterol-binding domain-containing protein [Deinococcus terrestris]